jgi:putative ABC transport system permease protein
VKSTALIIRLALAGIFENKTRAALTMLGIIIGVASVIAIMSIGAGAQSLITGSLKQMGTNLVAVLPGASNDSGPPAAAMGITITTLGTDDAEAIADLPFVDGISAYNRGTGSLVAGEESKDGSFIGITHQYPFVENHAIERGRFFTEAEADANKRVAVIGSEIKEDLYPYTDPLGKKLRIGSVPFTVIGVLERKGSSLFNSADDSVLIPLEVSQKQLTGVDHVSLVRTKINDDYSVPLAMENIRRLMRQRHDITNPDEDDFSVRSLDQAIETLEAVTGALKFFLASIAAISLIVGGIGITNVMLITVQERTREIGLKKAIGSTVSQIQNQFLLEALILTVLGGIVGIVVGTGLSYSIAMIARNMEYNWDFVISPFSVILALTVSLFVGVVFGLYPARKAARLNPIDALRYE